MEAGYLNQYFKAVAVKRLSAVEADPLHDPDGALLLWFDREEKMFKCMEGYLIQERLMAGFKTGDDVDVDAFIQFSRLFCIFGR